MAKYIIECRCSKKQRDVMCGSCLLGDVFELLDDQPTADVKEMPKEADYVEMMQECGKMNEIDVAHGKADDILCDLLEELGYKELVMAYGDVEKWYA